MTTLFQPLQRIIAENTWTGLDAARGASEGIIGINCLLGQTPKTNWGVIGMGVGTCALLNRITELNFIRPSRLFNNGLPAALAALNWHTVYQDQKNKAEGIIAKEETVFSQFSNQVYTYTPKVLAIGNIALAILEYSQRPVVSVMNLTVQAIMLGASQYLPQHAQKMRYSTILLTSIYFLYKGDPAEKVSVLVSTLVMYRNWKNSN